MLLVQLLLQVVYQQGAPAKTFFIAGEDILHRQQGAA